ncbi:hypothetical protein PRIPAC_72426 [Pristionchus pacificus]|uniref:Uncharacterized protein n=1 Tax=Pristionchus pacificus TaxID=54126 RepID=A0A2A6C5W9_PRIPA|nr:hypothetical protein PRIPAC_72426 [Pristionchus pacificus]|eukprot:PDM73453.1 hypothetical protein PRIPAC_40809 [Pristionchus pacificus]
MYDFALGTFKRVLEEVQQGVGIVLPESFKETKRFRFPRSRGGEEGKDADESIGQLEHVVAQRDDDELRVLRAVLNGKWKLTTRNA